MQVRPCTFVIVFISLCISCIAKVEKVKIYNINGLMADNIDVDIQSEIPGQITWILTDDHNFRLKLNVAGENENAINSVDINLTHNNASVKLVVKEKHFSIAPAPVTGTGNTVTIPAFLVLLLAILTCWNNPMFMVLVVAVYGVVPGTAETSFDIPKKTVHIEVKAPRRLSYHAVNLSVNGGKMRVVNWEREKAGEMTCKTNTASENGCLSCCHGNGVCIQNRCICDENYDETSSCATSKAESVFFSHPLDPRFDRTFLPNDDILTLGGAFQFTQQDTYLKDPEKHALEIKSRDLTLPRVLVMLHSNGFIEKIIDTKSAKENVIKFKKSRESPCIIRLKGNIVNKEINICVNNSIDVSKKEISSKDKEEMEYFVNKEERKNRRHKHWYVPENEFKYVELPVKIHRCGYFSRQQKYVYFKIFNDKMDPWHERTSKSESDNSLNENENIFVLSHKTLHETDVLRLRENSFPLGMKEITQKCEMTKSLHRKICFPSNLESLRIVCDDLSNHISFNNSTPSRFSKSIHLCGHVLKSVSSYCSNHYSKELLGDKSCLTHYTNNVNLFSTQTYLIQPFVSFPDDKLISGRVQRVNFGNISQLNFKNTELVIVDNNAEFKIVKISVIPKDPVPHDIYQVKLEYTCATSETTIKMIVYGSDFYSNSVTCHGVTQCNCCILHAAGAPNAVVDRVTINVTDPSRNYEMVREMVVVF